MRERTFLIRSIAGLLSLALLLAGVGGLAAPASAGLTGGISGTVTGPGGQPLADVDVVLYQLIDGEGYRVDVIQTEADGTYRFDGLYSAYYWLGFHSADYVDEWWDDATDLSDATAFTVTMDQLVSGKDAELAPAGHIAGTVTGPGGQPLPDITVLAFQTQDNWRTSGSVHHVDTGPDGSYDIGSLPPGTYRLGFASLYSDDYIGEYWDDVADLDDATDIEITAGQTVSGRNAELAVNPSAPGRIGGTVTGPDGQPLSAVTVRAYRRDGDQWVRATDVATGGLGRYDLALSPGDYVLQFEDPSGAYVDEYWDDAPSPATATSIHVDAGTSRNDISPQLAAMRPVTNGSPPIITGSPRVGETLVATTGSWVPTTTATRIQWLIGGVAVPGATGLTYTPTAADARRWVQVRVTGSASGFWEATATSPEVRVGYRLLQMVKKPVVRGAVRRGSVLRVSPGTWRPVRPTLHWGWFAGGQRILGANNKPLRLHGRIARLVAGKRITVRLSADANEYEPVPMKLKVRGRLR